MEKYLDLYIYITHINVLMKSTYIYDIIYTGYILEQYHKNGISEECTDGTNLS